MLRHKPIATFFIVLLLVYAALVAPWPGLDRAYLAYFRTMGNLLFHTIGQAGAVRFEDQTPPGDKWTTKVSFRNKRTGAEGRIDECSARHGYLLTALTAAMIVATPLPWSRRWLALLWGLLSANAVLFITTWLGLVEVFSADGPLRQFTLSQPTMKALSLAVRILNASPELPFAMPVFIWIAVAVRRRDLRRWFEDRSAALSPGRQRPGDAS